MRKNRNTDWENIGFIALGATVTAVAWIASVYSNWVVSFVFSFF